MKFISIIFVTFCHALLFFTLIGIESELLMADLSSEGLSELNADPSSFAAQYPHQKERYVITVDISDWIFPNNQEPSNQVNQEVLLPKPEPIIKEVSTEKAPPKSELPQQIAAPKKEIQQNITKNTNSKNHTQTQKGTGSGNRKAVGKGSGQNSYDGPAGFLNGDHEQTILRNIQRCYPLISRRRGEQGLAIVRIYVDTNGNSTKTEIIQSTNFSRLDKCALESVKSLKVKARTVNGQKTASYFDQPIRFRLN